MPEQGGSGDESWKRVWKLNVPPKVKVLWWRVLHDSLPTRDILNRHHVEPVGFCERCGAQRETIKHIFIECTTALAFCREVKVLMGVKLPRLQAHNWASDMLRDEVCSEKDRCILIIGMYSLWTQRNRHRHGEEQLPVRVAVQWAVDVAHDLWQLTKPQIQKGDGASRERWCAPQPGWIKCNTDGTFNPRKGQGATGAVLRNSTGAFLSGRATWYPHGLDALSLEALACRDGMILAADMGVQNLQVETDSQELVKLWTEVDTQRSRITAILKEVKDRSQLFSAFSLRFASRNCNRVAHVLAKQVSDDTRVSEWHLAPSRVSHLVTEDCNSIAP